MSKTFLVIRQELINTFNRRSYLVVAFIIPLLGVLVLGGIKVVQNRSGDAGGASDTPEEEWQLEVEGYIDQAGLIQVIPPDLPEGYLISYQNEDQAKQALAAGEIAAYYIIPPDVVENGEVFYVFPESKTLLDDGQKWVIKWTLLVNLLGGDLEAAERIWNPVGKLEERVISASLAEGDPSDSDACSRPGAACQANELIQFIPALMAVLFFMTFMTTSTMLLNSIASEKENRTMEVLLLSISPRKMLAGKTIGLAAAGLIQTIVWLGAVYAIFNMGGSTLRLPENFTFPADILLWSLILFLGGFGIYASLMAGVGALVPKMKDAGGATTLAMSPILLGYLVGILAPMVGMADAVLPLVLSFFPLTSPIVMVMRLTNSVVPLWQLLLATGLLLGTNLLINRATASLFQAQYLLSGQTFSAKRYFRLLLNRSRP